MSHRIWNRGSNGLPKLVQPYAPSILFPVRHPAIGPGTRAFVAFITSAHNTVELTPHVQHETTSSSTTAGGGGIKSKAVNRIFGMAVGGTGGKGKGKAKGGKAGGIKVRKR